MTDTRAIECPCFGSNENCFRCSGRGVISDGELIAPERGVAEDLDDSPIARLAEMATHGARYPAVLRPDPRTSLRLSEPTSRWPNVGARARSHGSITDRAWPAPSKRGKNKRKHKVEAKVRATNAPCAHAHCPHCGNAMPASSIAKHVQRKHRAEPSASRTTRFTTVAPSFAAHPVGIARAERSLDGSRGFHSFAREGGRFGSHPSFDGDE